MGQGYAFPIMDNAAGLAPRHYIKGEPLPPNPLMTHFLIDGAIATVTLGIIQEILSGQDPWQVRSQSGCDETLDQASDKLLSPASV